MGERTYPIPEMLESWPADSGLNLAAGEAYSVTTALGVIAKPHLIKWAADQEAERWQRITRRACVELAGELAATAETPDGLVKAIGACAYLEEMVLDRALKVLPEERASEAVLKKSGDIGKAMHAAIEASMKGEPLPEMSGQVAKMYAEWQGWAKDVELTPIHVEQKLWHPRLRYAGRTDLIGFVRGRLSIVDWKTGGIFTEARAQCAAYARAAHELDLLRGQECDVVILSLPKTLKDYHKNMQYHDAAFEEVRLTWAEQKPYAQVFKSALELLHAMKRVEPAWLRKRTEREVVT